MFRTVFRFEESELVEHWRRSHWEINIMVGVSWRQRSNSLMEALLSAHIITTTFSSGVCVMAGCSAEHAPVLQAFLSALPLVSRCANIYAFCNNSDECEVTRFIYLLEVAPKIRDWIAFLQQVMKNRIRYWMSCSLSPAGSPLQYLGLVEVEESRGMHVCEEAVKKLKVVSISSIVAGDSK